MYKKKKNKPSHLHSQTYHHNTNPTHCAILTTKDWSTKSNIHVSKTTNTLIDSCWIFSMWYEVWRENLWYFRSNLNHCFANRRLTLIMLEEEMIFTQALRHCITSYLWLLSCFVSVSLLLQLTFSLSFVFAFYFFCCMLGMFLSVSTVSSLKRISSVMIRKSVHFSLKSARLDRLLDPRPHSS